MRNMHTLNDDINSILETNQFDGCIIHNIENGKRFCFGKPLDEKFKDLFNKTFLDETLTQNLYGFLNNSILPQMMRQGKKFCILSAIDKNNKIVFGFFGISELGVQERYKLAEDVNNLMNSKDILNKILTHFF